MKTKLILASMTLMIYSIMSGFAQQNKAASMGEWQKDFYLPGVSDLNNASKETGVDIRAIVISKKGEIYMGGNFEIAGPVEALNIAMWDGKNWNALGKGVNGQINAMTIDSQGIVYAGGSFTTAGDVSCGYIARWNGEKWDNLNNGVNSVVVSLVCDENDNVYVSGFFTMAGDEKISYIAKWNGLRWTSLGTGVDDTVHKLASNGANGIYATGQFTTAGDQPANRIAFWNGEKWEAFSQEITPSPLPGMSVSSDGSLYISGLSKLNGSDETYYMARWTGTEWQNLSYNINSTITDHSFSRDGRLVINTNPNKWPDTTNIIYILENSEWQQYTAPLNRSVNILVHDYNNNLYAAGHFTIAGQTAAYGIARWDGHSWNNLAQISGAKGCGDAVLALASDGNQGVYAGGEFITAGDVAANYIAHFDGSRWKTLGQGFDGPVEKLVTDTKGILYAAGSFQTDGSRILDRIARWDGTQWESLESGINGQPFSMATDTKGNLYIGGNFNRAQGIEVNSITMWDGEQWNALGSGCECSTNPIKVPCVGAIVNDNKGNTYIGGRFTSVGGLNTGYIARWDGAQWFPLGSGLDKTVYNLAIDQKGILYACGLFEKAGDLEVNHIASWNGSEWTALGDGLGGAVSNIYIIDDILYATGYLEFPGRDPSYRIALWDGETWQIMEGEINNPIHDIAAHPDGGLYVAGNFSKIGTTISRNIGLFSPSSDYKWGDVNHDNAIDIVDALLIAQYYVGIEVKSFHEDKADVNHDNLINIVDALLVAQYYVEIIQDI